MTTRDLTFNRISHNEMLELVETSSGRKKLHYTPHERLYLEMTLKAKKEKVKKVLKQNKEGLADAKKRARSHSRSKSSDPPPANRNRKDITRSSCK